MALYKITIKNWDKHNPRKDVKHPSWFAFNNRMIEDADFFSFNHGEFKAWIYILSRASQKQSKMLEIEAAHPERVCNVIECDFLSACQKLETLGIISFHVTDASRGRHVDVQNPYATDRQTDNTDRQGTKSDEAKKLRTEIWETYRIAYAHRYGIDPVRNAKANGLVKQLSERIGVDAIPVVAFYLTHNDQYYIRSAHTLGPLIAQCEAVQTQWRLNQKITGTKAREIEKSEETSFSSEMIAEAFGPAAKEVDAKPWPPKLIGGSR